MTKIKESKTFSLRIKKVATLEELDEKIRMMRAAMIVYITELPEIEVQIAKLITKLGGDILLNNKEIREFLEGESNDIRFSEDYTNYNPQKCSDGGSYGFWQTIEKTETKGVFRIVHHTTSTFLFCPACGTFSWHADCGQYETIDIRK